MAQFCMNSVLITAFLAKIETAQRSRQGSGDGSYVDLRLLQRVDLLGPLYFNKVTSSYITLVTKM